MSWHRIMFSLAGRIGTPPHTLDKVARIARGLQTEVELFDCIYDSDLLRELPEAAPAHALIQQRVRQRRREVELWADALRSHTIKVHVSVHWDTPPHEAIVRHVLRHRPDLLIVPTRRANAMEQRPLSYTDHRLIETCPCPLLLLKTRPTLSHGAVVAAVDPPRARDQTAALDERILSNATTLAQAYGDAPLHICHLVVPRHRPDGTDSDQRQERERLESSKERVLAIAASSAVPPAHVHVESGIVETALPQWAGDLQAEVLVMGALSRSLTRRPSVTPRAEQILDALACDVLVVKPADFRSPVSRRSAGLSSRRKAAGAVSARAP